MVESLNCFSIANTYVSQDFVLKVINIHSNSAEVKLLKALSYFTCLIRKNKLILNLA
jgi:hypothetical protein